jgi:hypothetical protein
MSVGFWGRDRSSPRWFEIRETPKPRVVPALLESARRRFGRKRIEGNQVLYRLIVKFELGPKRLAEAGGLAGDATQGLLGLDL